MSDFINNRLNKDNFWNVMFFATLVGGVGIAFATKIMILSWFAIAGSIWIVKSNSSIVFDKEKLEFIINGSKRAKASGAEFIMLMFASFGVIAIIGFILDGLKIDDSPLLLAAMMSLLVLLPVLYCIFRNLPISVYFKKEAWIGNGKTTYGSISSDNNFSSNVDQNNFMHSSNYYRDIRNSFSEGNIFHHK